MWEVTEGGSTPVKYERFVYFHEIAVKKSVGNEMHAIVLEVKDPF